MATEPAHAQRRVHEQPERRPAGDRVHEEARPEGAQGKPGKLKVFVNTVGLYPVGTLVRLSSGELAVVVYGGGDAERSTRPVVALLDAAGKPSSSVDLVERDAGGRYLRSIVSAEDPKKYGLQSSGLVASSAMDFVSAS